MSIRRPGLLAILFGSSLLVIQKQIQHSFGVSRVAHEGAVAGVGIFYRVDDEGALLLEPICGVAHSLEPSRSGFGSSALATVIQLVPLRGCLP